MAGKKKEEADAELEDLDVREVSIVDRPAIKRRFLIVKRDNGPEEDMPKVKVSKDEDSSLLDLLFGSDDDKPDMDQDADIVLDEDIDLEAITKTAVEGTGKIVSVMVGKLTKVVSTLKSAEAAVPADAATEVKSIAKTLGGLVQKLGGKGADDKTEKAADSPALLKVCSASLQQLMSAATKIKEISKSAEEVPAALIGSISVAAVALAKSVTAPKADAEAGSTADDTADDKGKTKTTKKDEPLFRVFVTKGDEDNPEIIVKAGAKMKKLRLNQFRKAVSTLASLLKELEGDTSDSDKGVQKSDVSEIVNAGLAKGFELLEKKLGATVTDTVKASIEAVTKRLEAVEDTVPAGNGDADATETKPDEVKKTEGGMWSSVFAQQ